MAKYSDAGYSAASALGGTEYWACVQGGNTRIVTAAQVQTLALSGFSANGLSLGATTYSGMRTLLSLVPGTDIQAYSANLTTYAGIAPSANVQSILGAANYAAVNTLLGIGTAGLLASDTDGTFAANSDSRIATQKATKTYVDTQVVAAVAFASTSDVNTGTNTTKAINSDVLAGANIGIRYLALSLNAATALTTSDKAYQRIPAAFSGMSLVSVTGSVGTGAAGSSSSGTPTFTVKNVTDNNQMLSTSLTIDANEYTSATAAVPAVINASFDDVVTDDLIEVACTTAGTGTTYAVITLGFQLP